MWTSRNQTRIYNANRFKLGLFGMNCSGGLSLTKAPERWDASWENNVKAARLADESGLEFLLPIGRWHGYQGETDTQGTTFETLTWACGLLASTQHITTFGTLHVAFVNPVFAAKQMVTADHIGQGRFGLNIVSGWNPIEFGMFGVDLKDHDRRYAYSEEWIAIVKRIWSEKEPFDHEGQFFHLKGVLAKAQTMVGLATDPRERGQFRNGEDVRRLQCRLPVHDDPECGNAGRQDRRIPRRGPAGPVAQYFRELSSHGAADAQGGRGLPSLHCA